MHALPYEGALADRRRQSREEIAVPLLNVCRHKDSGSENRCQGNLLTKRSRLGNWGVNSIDSSRRRALGCLSWAVRRHLAWCLSFSYEWSKGKMPNPLNGQDLQHEGGFAFTRQWVTFGGKEGWYTWTFAVREGQRAWSSVCGGFLLLLYFHCVRVKPASPEDQGGWGPNWTFSGTFCCSLLLAKTLSIPAVAKFPCQVVTLSERRGRDIFVRPCLSVTYSQSLAVEGR